MFSVTPDQLASMGAYVAREWGDHGYRITSIESPSGYVSVGRVRCSDGGRFAVIVDRWGNCRNADDDDDAGIAAAVAELDANARAA